jgi:archaetidylinositol phosphate synthase
VLEQYREWARPHLDRLSRPFLRFAPRTLSWTSFSLFVLAGFVFVLLGHSAGPPSPVAPLLFLAAGTAIFLGGVFDALDGHVARRRHLQSAAGDLLDHVLDRYADLALLLGIAVSGWANPTLALLALVSLLLVSYMGTQAQAVLGRRQYRGWLGRADRILLLSIVSWVMGFWVLGNLYLPHAVLIPYRFAVAGIPLTPVDLVLLYFLVAGQVTAVYRARRTWQDLPPPPSSSPGRGPDPPADGAGSSSADA